MWNVAVLVGGSPLELVDSSFEVVNSSSEVSGVVAGTALSAGKRSFPLALEAADCQDVVCRPPEVELSEAVEAEADCNIESNSGARRWRLSSPDNRSWTFSLFECSQPRTASRTAPPSSSLQS